MPRTFENMGIAFQYPDNWTLDDDDAKSGRQSVTVYSPGGAFWTVAVHPPSTDPDQLALAGVEAMKEEYAEIEVERAADVVADREMTGYDLDFYYLDLVNSAQIRCLPTPQAVYVFFCQAEGREFDQLGPVFHAMTTSLVMGIGD